MLESRRSVIGRIGAGTLAVVLASGGFPPAVANQTPAAPGYRFVARVSAEEWATLETDWPIPNWGEELAGPILAAALREGGFVIYVRHALTDPSQQDVDTSDLGNCASQRNLTPEGREQARAMGEAIAALGIPIGEVLSSEYCRTRETARLAFGRVTPTRDLTPVVAPGSETEAGHYIAALRRLLTTPPAAGTNTVLVSHDLGPYEIAGIRLAQGEAAIFRPLTAAGVTATPSAAS